MKKPLATLCAILLFGMWPIHTPPARAADSDQILRRLAALEQENAALRDRVRRLEGQRNVKLDNPERTTTQTKIAGGTVNPLNAYPAMYKASPFMPASSFSWTGPYVGGHIGWGWQSTSVDDPSSVSAGNTFESFVPIRDFNPRGFLGGAQVGWNYQIGNLVIGNEINISVANLKGDRSDTLSATGVLNPNTPQVITQNANDMRMWANKTSWLGTATTRFGYALDRWLVYTKGGVAASRNRYDFVESGSSTSTGFLPLSLASTNSQTGTDTRIGWVVGGGVEWAFSGNWSATAEYTYMDFGNKPVALFGTTRGVATDAGGTTTVVATILQAIPIEQRIQTVKFGLNYRFGSTSDAIVANY